MKLTRKEFIDIYYTTLRENPEKSNTFCYEFSESVHISLFGERMYSDYNSFRKVLKDENQKSVNHD
jgi:hypothetical protein